MAAISASMVNDLRQRTGLGMMECKAALTEAGGDINVAIDNLRKKGVKAGVAARVATEGKAFVARSADGQTASAVEVLCNTDFTAKSDPVAAVLKLAAEALIADPKADLAAHAKIKDALVAVSQQTGENVTLGRSKVLTSPAKTGAYLYQVTGKIAVLVSVTGNASDELLADLCMHITACKPVAAGLKRDSVDAALVAKEREIAIEQAKATGKPQQIAEKIAEGKLNAFFKERVLLEQDFINGEKFKGTIQDMITKAGVTLVEYFRLEVGA